MNTDESDLQLFEETIKQFSPDENRLLIDFFENEPDRKNIANQIMEIALRHDLDCFACTIGYMKYRKGGASQEQALITLRCAASFESGIHEWFGVDDISCILGIPTDEADKLMNTVENRMTVSVAPWFLKQ